MNFSAIPKTSWLGRLLRFPLRLLPKDAVVWILQGNLRGWRWIAHSGIHGYWISYFERAQQDLFARTVLSGSVAYDVGAHVGFYTLLFSSLVGREGKVFAFEPLPRNLDYLRAHLKLNRVENVDVRDIALADQEGTARFVPDGPSLSRSHLDLGATEGALVVRTMRLDDLVFEQGLPAPDYIKVDIEGAEVRALTGAKRVLSEFGPTLFLSTHGADLHRACREMLEALGYRVMDIQARSRREGGGPDGLFAEKSSD